MLVAITKYLVYRDDHGLSRTFGKSQFQFQYAVNLRSSKLNR